MEYEYDMEAGSPSASFEGLEPFSIGGANVGSSASTTSLERGHFDFTSPTLMDDDLDSMWKSISPDTDDLFSFPFTSLPDQELLSGETESFMLPPLQEAFPVMASPSEMTNTDQEIPPVALLPIKKEQPEAHTSSVQSKKVVKVKESPLKKLKTEGKAVKLLQIKKPENQREANKLSAQASRQRKKDLKDTLEKQVQDLTESNQQIEQEIIELRTENRVLRDEFIQLKETVSQSMMLNKTTTRGVHRAITAGEGQGDDMESVAASSITQQAMAFMYLMMMAQTTNGASSTQATNTILPMMSALGIAH